MPYAGTIAFHRYFRPLPASRLDQRKQAICCSSFVNCSVDRAVVGRRGGPSLGCMSSRCAMVKVGALRRSTYNMSATACPAQHVPTRGKLIHKYGSQMHKYVNVYRIQYPVHLSNPAIFSPMLSIYVRISSVFPYRIRRYHRSE